MSEKPTSNSSETVKFTSKFIPSHKRKQENAASTTSTSTTSASTSRDGDNTFKPKLISINSINQICVYHMATKPISDIKLVEANQKDYLTDYDDWFLQCKNQHCRFSHNRKDIMHYFATHLTEWFDYMVAATGRKHIPPRNVYVPYRNVYYIKNESLQTRAQETEQYRPCFNVIDGKPCPNMSTCKYCHDRSKFFNYYLYHPSIYCLDVTYRVNQIYANPKSDKRAIGVIKRECLDYFDKFNSNGIEPFLPMDIKQISKISEGIQSSLNKLTESSLTMFAELFNQYIEICTANGKEATLLFVNQFAGSLAYKIISENKYTKLYYDLLCMLNGFDSGKQHMTTILKIVLETIQKTINRLKANLNSKPLSYSFQDGECDRADIANLVSFCFMFPSSFQIHIYAISIVRTGLDSLMPLVTDAKREYIKSADGKIETWGFHVLPVIVRSLIRTNMVKVVPDFIYTDMLHCTRNMKEDYPSRKTFMFAVMDALDEWIKP